MAGTALALPFPMLPADEPRAWLCQVVRGLARTRSASRPRSVAELQALSELETGVVALSLEEWEGIAHATHSSYRALGVSYADVVPEQLARAVGVRLVYQSRIWRPSYDPETRVATLARSSDRMAQAFDTIHEISEAVCVGSGGTHADIQWVTVALMVERDAASTALRRYGLVRGVGTLARTHRRVRRCFLWVRLAMIAAAG